MHARLRLEALLPRPHGLILAYHRVARLDRDPFGMATAPDLFEQHLELVRDRVVPLSTLLASRRGLALTFDDGYADNLSEVAPRLRARGLPATFFLTLQEQAYWWDRLPLEEDERHRDWRVWERPPTAAARRFQERYRQLLAGAAARPDEFGPAREQDRLLGKDERRRLAEEFDVGGHSTDHRRLPDREDLLESRRSLERELQRPIDALAYPFGSHDRRVRQAAREAGFRCALAARAGRVWRGSDPYRLPRLVADGLSGQQLRALILSIFGKAW